MITNANKETTSQTTPWLTYHPSRLIASAAASLNRLKRSLFDLRCSEIRSRNSDRTSSRR